ncbi:MAG: XisH family protein [Anaerolineae bacterium]|nr:XisH family protein [Anaerolineae bacterium]
MAKDVIHDAVKNALIKDGWQITADPYLITSGEHRLYVDLAADRPIAAERDGQKIAVEVKSFVGRSPLRDFEVALGQYMLYLGLLERSDPERKLYLAISRIVYEKLFQQETFQVTLQRFQVALLVVNTVTEEVEQWIN